VYEVDPLVCPRCGSAMRIIAFIEQPAVIEKILTHLGLWPTPVHAPPVAPSVAAWWATCLEPARAAPVAPRPSLSFHLHLDIARRCGRYFTPAWSFQPPCARRTAGAVAVGSRSRPRVNRRAAPQSKFLSLLITHSLLAAPPPTRRSNSPLHSLTQIPITHSLHTSATRRLTRCVPAPILCVKCSPPQRSRRGSQKRRFIGYGGCDATRFDIGPQSAGELGACHRPLENGARG
jgi:hypothetical protein